MQNIPNKINQNMRQTAVKGVVWSATQSWGMRAISFFVMLILARLVSPEAFGLIAYASVFIAFIQIFVDQGFCDAIVQCPVLDRKHLDTAFWISLFTGALLTLVSIVISGMVAKLFHEPKLVPIIRWLSLSFIFNALSSVQMAILERNLAFKSLALRSLVATIISCSVAVIMAFMGFGVWSLVAKLLLGSLVSVIALWQVSDWRPSFHFSGTHFRELFSFGINIVGGNLIDFFSLRSADFLIGYFLGSIALGYYALSYSLLMVLTELLVAVPNGVMFPTFSRLQGDIGKIRKPFYEVTQLQSIIAFPVFLGLSVIASEVISLLYGPKWNASIPVVQILMLIGIARSASYFYSSIFKALGKPTWRLGIWALTATLNIIGFMIAVRGGIVTVAAAYVFVGYTMLPLYFVMIRNLIQIDIRTHLEQYMPALCSSIVMVTSILTARYVLGDQVGLIIRLIAFIFVGASVYLLTLRLIKPLLYKQVLELVQLALPKALARQVG